MLEDKFEYGEERILACIIVERSVCDSLVEKMSVTKYTRPEGYTT